MRMVIWQYAIVVLYVWGQNDRRLASRSRNIGMLTDSQRLHTDTAEGECFDLNPGEPLREVGSHADESFLVGRPGAGFAYFRSREGVLGRSGRYLPTVAWLTLTPSLSNSPWIPGAPHKGLSAVCSGCGSTECCPNSSIPCYSSNQRR
jgi:hypothetical protein